MHQKNKKRTLPAAVSTAVIAAALVSTVGVTKENAPVSSPTVMANAAGTITVDDMPEEYV